MCHLHSVYAISSSIAHQEARIGECLYDVLFVSAQLAFVDPASNKLAIPVYRR